MLVERNEYLTAGVHIGMKTCTKYMKRFVYKIRDDGLAVFNLQMVDERIGLAAEMLSRYNSIMVVCRKSSGIKAVEKFAEVVGGKAVTGRFLPGMLTNPLFKDFYEPEIIVVVDPLIDKQAVIEAKKKKLPIVALCDTFNDTTDIDFVIPVNNNGKKSIALVFWILAREILKKRKKDKDFNYTVKDFGGE